VRNVITVPTGRELPWVSLRPGCTVIVYVVLGVSSEWGAIVTRAGSASSPRTSKPICGLMLTDPGTEETSMARVKASWR
jgi:hypothetical protein